MKHNKKRNTAFIYEALVRVVTDSLVNKDSKRVNTAIGLVKKHFKQGSLLRMDLECYRSIYETKNYESNNKQILVEAKVLNRLIDPNGLFKAQTDLIKDINTTLGPSTFNVFVPNYKTLASISQVFSTTTNPANKVLLENELLSGMLIDNNVNTEMKAIDNLAYKTFVEKFNKKYGGELLEEQKTLLTHYITSFVDNGLELKIHLNEEMSRLNKVLRDKISEGCEDKEQIQLVLERLSSFSKTEFNEEMLQSVLKIQALAKELE